MANDIWKNRVVLMYLARHGETVLNASNKFRGKMDVPLNGQGIADAHKLGYYLAPINFHNIVYSDMKRSRKTAEIIAKDRGDVKTFPTQEIWPWNVGVYSGQEKNEENVDALHYYISNPEITIPEGESLNDFKRRVQPAIAELIDTANNIGEPILAVGHSSIVHEVGEYINGHHASALVHPGGLIAVFCEDGKLKAEPIFKPKEVGPDQRRADTVS